MATMSGTAEDVTSVEGHVVQFYDRDDELVDAVARFAGAGLALGEGVLVVATPEHRIAFEDALRADGRSLEGYVALDAAETLACVTGPDGTVDDARFFDVVGGAVERAMDHPGAHVRVFGEMVALLCAAGERDQAMVLEALWNRLAGGPLRFTLLCAYPTPSMDDVESAALYYDACAPHTAVLGHVDAPLEAWRHFDEGTAAIARARSFVGETLERWGFPDVVEAAQLVVSELATNAVLHVRSGFHVSIAVVAGGVEGIRVTVHDESPTSPAPRAASPSATTGRGLRLVEAVSARWGTVPLPARKAVWAELKDHDR